MAKLPGTFTKKSRKALNLLLHTDSLHLNKGDHIRMSILISDSNGNMGVLKKPSFCSL